MTHHKSCCAYNGMVHGCRQGRDCPEQIRPPGWGHPIVMAMLAALIALVTGVVLLVKWLG